jgi:hypothetical protein
VRRRAVLLPNTAVPRPAAVPRWLVRRSSLRVLGTPPPGGMTRTRITRTRHCCWVGPRGNLMQAPGLLERGRRNSCLPPCTFSGTLILLSSVAVVTSFLSPVKIARDGSPPSGLWQLSFLSDLGHRSKSRGVVFFCLPLRVHAFCSGALCWNLRPAR